MKKICRKPLALLCLILCLILLLGACASGQNSGADSLPSDEENESKEPNGENGENAAPPLILAKDGVSDYQVVFPSAMLKKNSIMQISMAMAANFENRFGAKIPILSDLEAEKSDKEILVGIVRGRTETVKGVAALTAPGGMGYRISVLGEKVLISCESPEIVAMAISSFFNGIQKLEDGSYGIAASFSANMDLPEYSDALEPVVFYTGEGNYTATYTKTNYMVYRDYLTKLEGEGFVQYSSNHTGRNYFATYQRKTDTESMVVHTMFYEKLGRFEMTYGAADEYLPAPEKVGIPEEGAVTPSITQIGRNGSLQTAPGMSTILQLADASFVIFDGGPYDPQDEIDLFNFMKERTPEGQKPVIAAWFITHAHGDHVGLANSFLISHKDDVIVKLGAFNFPDFDSITIQNESASSMKSSAVTFKNLILSYPGAECWIMHTGQTLQLPGCEIRVIYTSEDSGSDQFAWGNHTCTAVRVKLNHTTLMVLGDSEWSLCQQMAEAYGTALESDVLSLSHHGFNGASLSLYKAVNPDICLWPVDSARFTEDPRCTGAENGYDFNRWLRNEMIKVREHYCADRTYTLYC